MPKERFSVDKVRASRAGHTFHERWTARRALQLIFPQDQLYAIAIEGLSSEDTATPGNAAEDVADLILYFGEGETFATCESLETIQFKYRTDGKSATSSYLKKTIQKFAETLTGYEKDFSVSEIDKKLTFSFITNCEFAPHLWEAILHLQGGAKPTEANSLEQLSYLRKWCDEKNIEPERLFARTSFQASTADLASTNRQLRRTLCDWSAGADAHSRKRLFELTELIREKAGPRGQRNNLIRREDVFDALGCDIEDLFPAETRFIDVGKIVPRGAQSEISALIGKSDVPVFLNADGGVGKTVFVQSIASEWGDKFEVVIFDCFGGGAYRSEDQGRHLPKVGLLQIVNELAARGLCDPILPTDNDTLGVIKATRKRLEQASRTFREQSNKEGILIILDASDNAQIEAENRNEDAFPRLLLSSLSRQPIDSVKLLLTARSHRMDDVIGKSIVSQFELHPFTKAETTRFLTDRRNKVSNDELAKAIARSGGNARVLDYLVKSWNEEIRNNTTQTEISVEELIASKCNTIFSNLHIQGWEKSDIEIFFTALSLLPPPIPLDELADALGWSAPEVRSAVSDLAPMLETVSHGAIFRDEPTETYIREQYSEDKNSQQTISDRLMQGQQTSMYAAQALPRFLEVIDDVGRAYKLAESDIYPSQIQSEFGRRRLKLARLQAAFTLAAKREDFDLLLKLSMQMAQVASANARGDEFVRCAPGLAAILGDQDAFRRLLNDRTGWHGAKNCRLTVGYCFLGELEEAEIHYGRAVGWLNWHFRNRDDNDSFQHDGPKDDDFASVMFFSVLTGDVAIADKNLDNWNERFSQRIANKIISLIHQYEALTNNSLLPKIVNYASSKSCRSIALQVAVLADPLSSGTKTDLQRVARSAGSLCKANKIEKATSNYDDKRLLEIDLATATFSALVENSKNSAQNIFKAWEYERPSSYDYSERHGPSRAWSPVLSSCLKAWTKGDSVAYHHLLPHQVSIAQNRKKITNRTDAIRFLERQEITYPNGKKDSKGRPAPQKLFDTSECRKICDGIERILALVNPIEVAILRKDHLQANDLHQFLTSWLTHIRDVHWNAEEATDYLTRTIGLGFAILTLQHVGNVEESDAQKLIGIVSGSRFSIEDRIRVLRLIAQRDNLKQLAGEFGLKITEWVCKDEYVEQRGENFRKLSQALLPLGIAEAREYYKEGLAQLDQMGGDDYDLVYSVLRYADAQRGGSLKPHLSQRLMNLSQIIAHHEPSKFGWTLYSSAAASSIGFPAVYKFLRWADQDVSDFSYGLPQLVCFLAKNEKLCPKRATAILTLCEDRGWHEWQVGRGLKDILSATQDKDQKSIVEIVVKKLRAEHCDGGWDSLWGSLLSVVDGNENLMTSFDADTLRTLKQETYERRHEENERRNNYSPSYESEANQGNSENEANQKSEREQELERIVRECDPCSAMSIDAAIHLVRNYKRFDYGVKEELINTLAKTCPIEKRVDFVFALCEVQNLRFDDAVDHIIKYAGDWQSSSAFFAKNPTSIVEHLLTFKGSKLFDLRYAGISRQINRLSKFCGSRELVIRLVVKAVANEHLVLDGDEWLELASCIAEVAKAETGLEALEQLLSSPFAKVSDEIGEGAYKEEFAAPTCETEMVVDVFWHLLGDEDAFIRWNSARSILVLAELGLNEELRLLLGKIGVPSGPQLRSEEKEHAFFNAGQWLLIGLARATYFQPSSLRYLAPEIEELFHSCNTHIQSKIFLARCLSNIWRNTDDEKKSDGFWEAINIPAKGYVVTDDWPKPTESKRDFRFDYDFDKYKVSGLGRLFGISEGDASDAISDEVCRHWPSADNMGFFAGQERYHRSNYDRHETFREHIQRHALLSAATELSTRFPVSQRSYDSKTSTRWLDWINEHDLTFEDGTWLADRKDAVPDCAQQFLLGLRKNNTETLCDQDELLQKIGLDSPDQYGMYPIYGNWQSLDGVNVRIVSALVNKWGSVRRCTELSKLPDHELWLPTLDSEGQPHDFQKPNIFSPWIWQPEAYQSGLDEGDKFAARTAATREKIGHKHLSRFNLASDDDGKTWCCPNGNQVLQSTAWGSWTSGTDGFVQQDGSLLRASRSWLDEMMSQTNLALAYYISIEKYKSHRSFETNDGVKSVKVGLLTSGSKFRSWNARLASQTRY